MEIKTVDKFGRLTVVGKAIKRKRRQRFRCLCDCGRRKVVRKGNLTNGSTKSCGCLNKTQNGLSDTKEYNIWNGMIRRCYNIKYKYYKDYGGRGIKICKRWRRSFKNFYKDMGKRPPGKSLDRRDNDGNYEPGNCRWATPTEQARNQRIRKSNKTGIPGVWWDKKTKIPSRY